MTHILLTYWKDFFKIVFAVSFLAVLFFVLLKRKNKAKVVQMNLPVLDECEDAISN